MLGLFKRYLLVTDDDKLLKDFVGHIAGEDRIQDDKEKILFDFTHVYYPKWNLKHALIIQSKRNKGYYVEAFSPSRLYFWYGLKFFIFFMLDMLSMKKRYLVSSMKVDGRAGLPMLGFREVINCVREGCEDYNRLKSKADLIDLEMGGVKVGDLIYDTYLKWFRKPTVDIRSFRLRFLLVFSRCYACKINKFLGKNNYREMYLTHAVYIGFGFLARLALDYGVKVYVTQNTRGTFMEMLSIDHPFQTPRFEKLKEISDALDVAEKENGRKLAEKSLEQRLSGVVDSAIYYMRQSGYSRSNCDFYEFSEEPFPGRPRVVVFLHCFFDSPHIYRSMLFVDFFEWLEHLLEFCENHNINAYVKEHPNALPGNESTVKYFKGKYRKAIFLAPNISNSVFLSGEFALALTVYGTIAHEFAYKGMPVLNAGDNPHVAYGFTLTPSSVQEYDKLLLELTSNRKFKPDKHEVLDFFYTSYLRPKWNVSVLFDEMINNKGSLKDDYDIFLSSLNKCELSKIFMEVDKLLVCYQYVE